MDNEAAKAQGASIAAMAVGAALSAIPVVGAPAAMVAQFFGNIPAQKRIERILNALQRDVTLAFERIEGVEASLLESEEFNAAIMRVVRESLETSDEEKREHLRNGLVNGYIAGEEQDQRDRFLSLIGAYEPSHVMVLRTLLAIGERGEERIENAQSMIASRLQGSIPESVVWPLMRDLVSDGLVFEINDGAIREEYRGVNPVLQQVVRPNVYHGVSPRGKAFLKFIASPFVAGAGGTA